MLRTCAPGRIAHRFCLPAAALLLPLLAACRTPNTPAAAAPHVKLDLVHYQLANGLDVTLHVDHHTPVVAVNLWYHVGPANETAGRTGFAHLFEHMMFQASGHTGEDVYIKDLEAVGASFVNASTDFDRTNYAEDLPSDQLELALWLESDRMGFLLDRLDAPMLANQQSVVRNERREVVENQPYSLGEERVFHLMFPPTHPYHAYVIGSHADIQAARVDDVREFFRRYYCPNNASLVIAGDIDTARVRPMIEKYFGTIPRGQDVAPITAVTPPILSERRDLVPDRVELPRVYMAWLTSPIFKPGDAEATVAAQILAGGPASRLYEDLVYRRKIAQDVSAQQRSLQLGSVFQIIATAKPGHTADELEQAIDADLDSLANRGPSDAELTAARNAITSRMIFSLEQLGADNGIADRVNMYNQFLHDPDYLNRDLDRFAAVTAADVRDLAARDLQRSHRALVQVVPGRKEIPPGPPTPKAPARSGPPVASLEPWRNTMPKSAATAATPLPAAQRFTLANGMSVYLVERHVLPIVSAYLAVRSGGATDPTRAPGRASFAVAMLDQGTVRHDALGLAREVDAIGARLSTATFRDGCSVYIQALSTQIDPAAAVLGEVALTPTFPPAEVERVRNDRLTSLLEDRDQPTTIMAKLMWSSLYGPDHPYSHPTQGTAEGLRAVSVDDLHRFWSESFRPHNAALVLAGDLTLAQAHRLAERTFGSWKGAAGETPRPPAPTPVPERVLVVDKPGSSQSTIALVQLAVPRSDPDYEALNLLNQVLGGLFTSRVNLNLREKHGYTYGAYSSIGETRGVAPLLVTANVQIDATGASIRESLNEVEGMLKGAVSAGELDLARQSVSRSLPALFQTTAGIAGAMGSVYLYDLPPDYYAQLPGRIAALTADSLFAATRRHLDPAAMKVIAVGDRRKIDAQIAALKLGPIGYRTTDGAPPGTLTSRRFEFSLRSPP